MTDHTGKVVSVNGNLVSVAFDGNVSMNEICYVLVGDTVIMRTSDGKISATVTGTVRTPKPNI